MKQFWIFFVVWMWQSCSFGDPEIPVYNSSKKESLPEIEILSVENVYIRQACVRIGVKKNTGRKPLKMQLCYSRVHSLPGMTDDVIDLLPDYREGEIMSTVTNLRPSTLYYCRVYVKTRDEEGYSAVFKFRTLTPESDQAWEKVCDFPSGYDWYEKAVVIGNDVYIRATSLVNHMDPGSRVIWKFTPSSGNWKRIKDYPGGNKVEQVMFSIGNKLYVGLGAVPKDSFLIYQTDFWEYDPLLDEWRRKAEFPKIDCAVMGAFGCKENGYVVSSEAMWQALPMTVYAYDPITNTWNKKADFPGKKVSQTLVISIQDRFFIIGGAFEYGSDPLFSNCLWEYKPDTDTWFRRADFPGTGRWNPRGFAIGNRFYAGYGEESGLHNSMEFVNDLWMYAIETDNWEPRSTFTRWLPYYFSLSFGVGEYGYIGSAALGLWKYMPEKDK